MLPGVAGCMEKLEVERGSADLGVVNAFVGEVEEEIEVDNDSEMALRPRTESIWRMGKGRSETEKVIPIKVRRTRRMRGEEDGEGHETGQGLKPLVENPKDLVGLLGCLTLGDC